MAHRAALAGLAGAAAALGLFYLARRSRRAMDWWVDSVSMPVKRALGAVFDPLPFSVCEAGATLLILGALALLGRAVWRAAHGSPAALAAWGLHLAVLVLWGYVGVCALWGTQYYAASFAEKAGMAGGAVSAEQLTAVAAYFGRQASALADTVERRAKPAFYSKLMSAWGFTGYLCPLTGESTLNVDCPAVFLPVTIAHEYAHQRGVAAEQEANFVGILASITSGKDAWVYSGWLYGYLHLSNALWRADPEAAAALSASLPAGIQADFAANNAYWASWEGPVREVGETVYDAFLHSYGQELGMQSYGACVDLLVEAFWPVAQN